MENTTIKNCSSCGKPMDVNAAFCGICGSRFIDKPTIKHCPSCGEELEPSAAFCANCGNRLAEQQASQPVFQQAAPQNQQQVPVEKKKKNKGCLIAVGIVVLLFLLPIIAALLNGGEINVSSANIAEVYLASEVNPDTAEPLVKTDVFPGNETSIVYVTARIRNVPGNTKVSSVWRHISSDTSVDKDLVIDSDQWVLFNIGGVKDFPGEWTVKILINDKVEKTLDFKVE